MAARATDVANQEGGGMDRRTMVVTLALALAAPGIALGADKAK